jgi:quinol monooxygenase YgiN
VYARSTTIAAKHSSIDAGIAHLRDEVMPALRAMNGCIGISLLVDRESGRCIATSAWETEEAMRASADQVQPVRDRAVTTFGGTAAVAQWEIAILHRDHHSGDGACVRAIWLKVVPNRVAESIEFYKAYVLPAIEEFDGFCSASLLVDRASGRAVASATFESREAMDRNRDQATALRTARIRDLGADVLDVGEFELALAHLRVPELI